LLDPHEWWSGDSESPGGPAWDVVENQNCVELRNHLETFRVFDLDTTQGIQQTIIRVPLRTEAQAARSKIVGREISVNEIRTALEQFAEEMKEGGLLFLKHVRSIILRIDNEIISKIQILEEGSDLKTRRELPLDFKQLYVPQTPPAGQREIFKKLTLRIQFSSAAHTFVQTYLIQHTMMMSSGDIDLDNWASQRKLFPWTAVAVLLDVGCFLYLYYFFVLERC
jgi:sacsin